MLLLALAAPCRADLSFVQIVQAQTNVGSDGFFGKTWVEVSGDKMRLISGYAPKAPETPAKKKKGERPLRLIQILDLGATALYLIDPSSKIYEARSLRDVRYGDLLKGRLANGAARYRVTASTVTLEPGNLRRKLIDTFAEHYHISVELTLEEPAAPGAASKPVRAAMEQDIWMAPLSGKLMKGLLDLMAFDSRYRALTGRDFTPLDFGTYQLPEAAAYLQVPASDIEALVLKVKGDLLSVPGYPLSSSVSWWKKTGGTRKAKKAAPKPEVKQAPKAEPPPMASRPPAPRPNPPRLQAPRKIFRPINLQGSWRIMEQEDKNDPRRARRKLTRFFRRTEQTLRRHEGYEGFQNEMRRVIESLENYQLEEARGPEFGPRPHRRPEEPPPPPPPAPAPQPETIDRPRSPNDPAPFYEIFSELDSFEFRDFLPGEDFAPPAGYERREIGIMAK